MELGNSPWITVWRLLQCWYYHLFGEFSCHYILLWFVSVMFSKISHVKDLVPRVAISRDETLWKWLDHEGINLISGLTHQRINNLNELIASGRNYKSWNLLERSGSLGLYRPLHLSLLPGFHKVSRFSPPCLLCNNILPRHSPKSMEPDNCRLKLWAKVNLLKWFMSGILIKW